MANQYPHVLKVFEHLKEMTGGAPAELKPNKSEKCGTCNKTPGFILFFFDGCTGA